MNDDKQFRYDVFISYRWVDPDKTWVRDQLEPALTNAGLEVCLDVHDFLPGHDLILEMTRAGRESRHGLCVLSPDYVNDPNRMVNFESLMLRRTDPSGSGSRLIPFILRPTEVPDHLKLIPVDWTNPVYHEREWAKLLSVLGAKDLEAPAPGPLVIDPAPQQAPVIAPSKLNPSPSPFRAAVQISKPVWISALAVLLLAPLAIFYIKWSQPTDPDKITVQGNLYYKQAPGNQGLIAVQGVRVFLAQDSSVRSEPTGSDGKFVLPGVPGNTAVHLNAEYGGVIYPMEYQPSGNYAVIPLDSDPTRKFIPTPWVEEKQEPCVPNESLKAAHSKVFKKDIEFQAEGGKNDALLTVELVNAPEMIILSADVLATPHDSVRNVTRPNEDRRTSHSWKFTLSKSAPRPQLLICLGSDNRPDEISSNKLFTYYTLP